MTTQPKPARAFAEVLKEGSLGAFLWDVRVALGKGGVDPALVGYFSVLTDPQYAFPMSTVADGLNRIGDTCPVPAVREAAYAAVVALAVKDPGLEAHSQHAVSKLHHELHQPECFATAIRRAASARRPAPAAVIA